MTSNSLLHPVTQARLARKPALSIAALARLADVDRSSLTKVENGQRDRLDPDACGRLVDALPGLDLRKLLDWKWPRRKRSSSRRSS